VPRYTDDPVKYVISFRVTADEKEILEELSSAMGMNLSTLLRKTLNLLEERHSWLLRGQCGGKTLTS